MQQLITGLLNKPVINCCIQLVDSIEWIFIKSDIWRILENLPRKWKFHQSV